MDDLKDTILKVARLSDYFMPGLNECKTLISETNINNIKEKFLSIGIKRIIIKDGSLGSYYIDENQTIFEPSFVIKKVVDTVGAGDGFAVGIISSILENIDLHSMLIRANAIGAIQVTSKSDNEDLPSRNELSNFISQNERKKLWNKKF